MLGNEDRVPAKWGLPAVVRRRRGCEPPRNELLSFHEHPLDPADVDVGALRWPEPEPSPKCRAFEGGKKLIEGAHTEQYRDRPSTTDDRTRWQYFYAVTFRGWRRTLSRPYCCLRSPASSTTLRLLWWSRSEHGEFLLVQDRVLHAIREAFARGGIALA